MAATSRPCTEGLATYRRHLRIGCATTSPPLGGMVEVRSQGAWVETADGRRYLDFGGHDALVLGHRHPAVLAAVRQQLDRHPLASRTSMEPMAAAATTALAATTPGALDVVHFVRSGAEATEAALHLARLHGRTSVISTSRGMTPGGSDDSVHQNPARPLLPDVSTVPYGDLAAMVDAVDRVGRQAVVILEPVRGAGAVLIPPVGYLHGVAQACAATGAMLVVDETQTGLGRLGTWWGVDAEDVVPDMLLVGTGLSGGAAPLAALVVTTEAHAPFAEDPFPRGSHHAGSPITCAAAVAAITAMHDDDVVRRAARLGDVLLRQLRRISAQQAPAGFVEARGRGLLLGVEFDDPALVSQLALELTGRGVLPCHPLPSSRVLRLAPPALLDDREVATFLHVLDAALAAL